MKFNLKFWEKLSPRKRNKDEKSLVPSRKPRVRLNLKGVKINREVPKKEYQVTQNKTSIDLNTKEKFTSKSNIESAKDQKSIPKQRGKGFRMPENFPFFGKNDDSDIINSEKKVRLDEDFLKDEVRRPRPWGLMFLIFSVILLITTTIWVFWNSSINTNSQGVLECKQLISNAVVKGLKTDDLGCGDGAFGLSGIFGNDIDDKKAKIEETLEQREKETQQKIQTLHTQLETLQGNLDVFGVKKEIKVIDDKNYQNIIAELQKEIQDFEKILTEKKENIDQFILNYQYLLGIGKNLPLEEEKRFLDEYEKMNTDQMFENFNLFKESFSQLQEKLKFQISQENPFAAKGFSDPEFFNYKIFEPAEFVKVFDEKKLPDTEPINIDSEITEDKLADKRIFDIAQKRGYQKRNLATQESLISFGDQQIHQKVVENFELLQKAAKEDGVEISIVSGYRSVDNQQDLFASRFEALSRVDNSGQLYDANEIVSGKADNTINKVLEQSSVPGYSKHHTGYTIDINQNDGSGDLTSFGNTDAYKWVSANNYFNAKRFGFVPSYPSGAKNVGPEPEPWEYVWVGTEDLKN